MTDSKGKLWIDVSDLVSWSGHFTGIQRVTYEMALRFYEQNKDTRFFAYYEHGQQFYEVDFGTISDDIIRSQQPQPEVVRRTGLHRPSPKAIVRTQSLRVYRNLPFSVKRRLTPARKERAKQAYHVIGKVGKRIKSSRPQISSAAVSNAAPISFSGLDTVLIMDKPWDTMTFVETLRTQKLNHDFKLVHLIYDMIPTLLPHVFGKPLPTEYTKYMFEALSMTSHVIAISESTKRDVIRFCEEELLPTPEVSVIRLGDATVDTSRVSKKHAVPGVDPGEFVLCVGTIEIRKNHILLYTAYKEAQSRGIDLPKLVIVGGKGWYTGDVIYQFKNDPFLKDKVKILHGIPDEQVAWLYKNCAFTVYPSVYEGWGLPIAESLAYGKVCVASNASSMPEIGGKLVDYFSPYDAVGCLELMSRYLTKNARSVREADIRKTYKAYTWDQTFSQVAATVK